MLQVNESSFLSLVVRQVHSSIPHPYRLLVKGCREAGANHKSFQARGGVHPGQAASLLQGHRDKQLITHTYEQFKSAAPYGHVFRSKSTKGLEEHANSTQKCSSPPAGSDPEPSCCKVSSYCK